MVAITTSDRRAELPGTVSGVIRLKPQQFIHILDNNTGVTRLELGPQTITLQDHERLVLEPTPTLIIPPQHYCIVKNPVLRDETGEPLADRYSQIRLRYGDREIRLSQDPFPLYPGEELDLDVTPLHVVETNQALRLRAIRDLTDGEVVRAAGDEWLFEGPGTYIPRVEVEVAETIAAIVIKPNQALKLLAQQNCIDRQGQQRRTGEEWLVREEGAYLPGVDEEVIAVVQAFVLTEQTAPQSQAHVYRSPRSPASCRG
jgi:major vault protein